MLKRRVKISVSGAPETTGAVACRTLSIREGILRRLLGEKRKVTVLIPGDGVEEIAICEAEKGEDDNGKKENAY